MPTVKEPTEADLPSLNFWITDDFIESFKSFGQEGKCENVSF